MGRRRRCNRDPSLRRLSTQKIQTVTDQYRLGIDIGGTFTDGILLNETTGEILTAKVPSTPADPSVGFLNIVDRMLAQGSPARVGNVLRQRGPPTTTREMSGACPVLRYGGQKGPGAGRVASGGGEIRRSRNHRGNQRHHRRQSSQDRVHHHRGFPRLMLEIQTGIRPTLYDLQFQKLQPLVPRYLCFGCSRAIGLQGRGAGPAGQRCSAGRGSGAARRRCGIGRGLPPPFVYQPGARATDRRNPRQPNCRQLCARFLRKSRQNSGSISAPAQPLSTPRFVPSCLAI